MNILKKIIGLLFLLFAFTSFSYGLDISNEKAVIAKFEKSINKKISNLTNEEKIEFVEKISSKLDNIMSKLYQRDVSAYYRYYTLLNSMKDVLDEKQTSLKKVLINDYLGKVKIDENDKESFEQAILDLQKFVNTNLQETVFKGYFDLLKKLKIQDEGDMQLSAGLKTNIMGMKGNYSFNMNLSDYVSKADFMDSQIDGILTGSIFAKDGMNDIDASYSMMVSMIQKNLLKYYKISDLESNGFESNEIGKQLFSILESIESKGKYVTFVDDNIDLEIVSNMFALVSSSGLNEISSKAMFVPVYKEGERIYFIPSIYFIDLLSFDNKYMIDDYYDLVIQVLNGTYKNLPYIELGNYNTLGYDYNEDIDLNTKLIFNSKEIKSFDLSLKPLDLEMGKGFFIDYKKNEKLEITLNVNDYESIDLSYISQLSTKGIESIVSNVVISQGEVNLLKGNLDYKNNQISGNLDFGDPLNLSVNINGTTDDNKKVNKLEIDGTSAQIQLNYSYQLTGSDLSLIVKEDNVFFFGLSLVINKINDSIKDWDFKISVKDSLDSFSLTNIMKQGVIDGKISLKLGSEYLFKAITKGTYKDTKIILNNQYEIDLSKLTGYVGNTMFDKLIGNMNYSYEKVDNMLDFDFDYTIKDVKSMFELFFNLSSKSKQGEFKGEINKPVDYVEIDLQSIMK